ncbi:MAG: hypothetical protein B7Z42_02710 [Brevundimonas sp. 12-68-7]|uniref:Uncharacterized protein n=1 Tax=Brevundimonas subvibrioides TaxID=74313 RepID=A0A258FRQ1_9CAUL|nr:MAG: hypothetical protein B7Z42_02710 [Brevundimonas sp. 12-68-7]OYX35006.1 MAG: hypothetical protein B7Z01_03745 [Brevundimonas subvibrioides]
MTGLKQRATASRAVADMFRLKQRATASRAVADMFGLKQRGSASRAVAHKHSRLAKVTIVR